MIIMVWVLNIGFVENGIFVFPLTISIKSKDKERYNFMRVDNSLMKLTVSILISDIVFILSDW